MKSIKLSEELHRVLKVKCAENGITIQDYIDIFLRKDLNDISTAGKKSVECKGE